MYLCIRVTWLNYNCRAYDMSCLGRNWLRWFWGNLAWRRSWMWAILETRKSIHLLCGAHGHGIDCCQVTRTPREPIRTQIFITRSMESVKGYLQILGCQNAAIISQEPYRFSKYFCKIRMGRVWRTQRRTVLRRMIYKSKGKSTQFGLEGRPSR